MGLTVTTPAPTVLLTTVDRVKAEMGVPTTSANDGLLLTFVKQAGAMAEKYCQRVFPRQVYSEVVGAHGGPHLVVSQAPVVALGTISYSGDTLTDVTIEDAAAGLLYRQSGFFWTAQRYGRGGLGSGLFMDQGMPIPLSEEPDYTIAYTAGFVTRDQDLCAKSTLSSSSTDDSFNDSASGFPSLLKSGDIIETSGFATAANNGRFVVSGTPTTAKVIVTSTLVTDAVGGTRTILFSTLPGDVERGIIEITKSLYAQRATDSMLIEKQAGPMRLRYSENRGTGNIGLPPTAAALLRPWVRRMQ